MYPMGKCPPAPGVSEVILAQKQGEYHSLLYVSEHFWNSTQHTDILWHHFGNSANIFNKKTPNHSFRFSYSTNRIPPLPGPIPSPPAQLLNLSKTSLSTIPPRPFSVPWATHLVLGDCTAKWSSVPWSGRRVASQHPTETAFSSKLGQTWQEWEPSILQGYTCFFHSHLGKRYSNAHSSMNSAKVLPTQTQTTTYGSLSQITATMVTGSCLSCMLILSSVPHTYCLFSRIKLLSQGKLISPTHLTYSRPSTSTSI